MTPQAALAMPNSQYADFERFMVKVARERKREARKQR
jgi:hypothetical protein